jgi:ribosomal protein L11
MDSRQAVQRGDGEPAGNIIPVVISIYEDRTFTFITAMPPPPN